MKKFNEIPYHRPDIEKLKTTITSLLKDFNASQSADEQIKIIEKINKERNDLETMYALANIKYTLDTVNKGYIKEQNFFDVNYPVYQNLVSDYYKAILASKYRRALEEKFGKQLFKIAEMTVKTISEKVLKDLEEENILVSEYTKLLASAKIPFDGKVLNISEIGPYLSNENREIRKNAQEAMYSFFTQESKNFDTIYDKLVKLRTNIAHKLGFKNYVELAYNRMLRADYNSEMVSAYRNSVKEFIVPIATKLRKKQAERLGVDTLKYYDEPVFYKTGNANPKGNPEWIVNNAKNMYSEMSPETKQFFDFMLDNDLMDLEARKGKATGGYCTYINNYKSPYIFSNFNGTTHDIIVLTHEAGHAFQVFSSRNFELPEYGFPTMEACEIHSMSMEFLTWPWMNLFFKEDTDKFKYSHVAKAIQFLPYGVAVDEFQHWIYENPEASPKERNLQWRVVEKKYLPHRNYDGNEFLENGGFWQQQRHIYASPFYYIDYTLAQTCAFQFWQKATENPKGAWEDYIKLCKEGGSKSFLNLVELANLTSPFNGGCLESVAGKVENWLETIDDKKL